MEMLKVWSFMVSFLLPLRHDLVILDHQRILTPYPYYLSLKNLDFPLEEELESDQALHQTVKLKISTTYGYLEETLHKKNYFHSKFV